MKMKQETLRLTVYFLLLIWLLPAFGLHAQNSPHFAFTDHEKVTYNVFYNWGFIWLEAAEVYFKTEKDNLTRDNELHLEGFGKTLPNYDWIFKVRGSYSTYVDKETLLPNRHFRDTYEGGFELHNQYEFDYLYRRIIGSLENSDSPKQNVSLELKPGVMDVLTATYYVRNIDFSNMQTKDTMPVSILLSGEYFHIYIRYLGKETIEDRQGRTWDCLKFSALLVEGTIFEGGEDMLVWVTDDGNKIPVLVEAKILVGSVKAYLATWEGVEYPLKHKSPDGQ